MKTREEWLSQEGYITVQEAAGVLLRKGIVRPQETNRFIDQAVRKLIKQGEIEAIAPPKNRPKYGWLISQESLDEYVEVGTMSVSQLRKELMKAKRELKKVANEFLESDAFSETPATHPVEEKQDAQADLQKDEKADALVLEEEKQTENTPVFEGQIPDGNEENKKNEELSAFDYDRVDVKYPKKPREIATNTYVVEFTLNGEKFAADVQKTDTGFYLLGVSSLERTLVVDGASDYLSKLEEALLPKIEKKFK